MELGLNGNETMNTADYFAKELLAKLDTQDPIFAAFEAQDESKKVGFDFTEIEDVLERALDEVRETREAYEEGEEGRVHFGDEIADLAFSLTNLIRHRGVAGTDLIETDALTTDKLETVDVIVATEDIAEDMKTIADRTVSDEEAKATYEAAMQKCAILANSFGFNVGTLLRENVKKYLDRCEAIEILAAQDQKSWDDLYKAGEIVKYWKRAKEIL